MSRVDPAATVKGKLRYRGGLVLTSSDRDFGGLSGLVVSADGSRFVAVSDQAHWVTGSLEYEAGRLVGVTGDTIAPLLDTGGEALDGKEGDAEGLASVADDNFSGDLLVSFEGRHRLWRYPFGRDGVGAVPRDVPLGDTLLHAPNNRGIEGIARLGDGLFLTVSERFLNLAGEYRAWVMPLEGVADSVQPASVVAGTPAPHATVEVSIKPNLPFAMTDVNRLPDGDILTLERRFNPRQGLGVAMRRVPSGTIRRALEIGGAILDGEVVATFDQSEEIDNMEGLAVRRGADGETLVYVVSDDNFNRPIQRTLLVMYELMD